MYVMQWNWFHDYSHVIPYILQKIESGHLYCHNQSDTLDKITKLRVIIETNCQTSFVIVNNFFRPFDNDVKLMYFSVKRVAK